MSSGWVPPVVSAVKELWASDWSHCSFLYMNVCEVPGHIGHIAGHLAGLLYLGC